MNINQKRFPERIFISGTDTGVGKSVVSAILMKGLRGIYWKPVQSGLDEITDTEWIREKTGLPDNHFQPETYRLSLPLSPHASAAHDGVRIDLEAFQVPEIGRSDYLIIEGAGGIMVPLNEHCFMMDLMKKIASPVLLVSSSTLGTINHTLLSLAQLRRQELDVMGVVMNGPVNPLNREAIEYYGGVRVLAEIEPLPIINPQSLAQGFKKYFMSLGKYE
ncbi:dethiobiotin synthase [Thermodesulfobacteriota bacterium]